MTKSTPALAATQIRKILKEKFPQYKFSVTSSSYSMGSSVDVTNLNGFASQQEKDEVKKVLRKWEYGSFDGMVDGYNYDNRNDAIPQVKFVMLYNGIAGVSGGYGKYGTDFDKLQGVA
ncbi:hypothetical protein EKK58_12865 [Candidatus Dependentiae bacterium]|nr:MAG: hypothetical protein EKK58_12865 [Candidatus Dependentiae bacterium]